MSDKPVAERLQLKGARRLAVIGAPAGIDRVVGAADRRAAPDVADVLLLFVANRGAWDRDLPALLEQSKPDAILWVAYPKLTSRLAADLSRDRLHEMAPAHGLDTVSQIAIDADWSALRMKRVSAG